MSIGFLFAAAAAGLLFAQGTRGTVSGVVLDQSKAVVQKATVKLIDSDKNMTVQTVIGDEKGEFRFLEVEPANYEVVTTAPGFAETRLTNVKVEPNRNVSLTVSLGVAGTVETITVNGSEVLVDHESVTLGTTVDHVRVEGLPLNGRNVLDLAFLQPGVAPSTSPTGSTFAAGLGMRVNGGRGVENNITLDGSNNNELAVGGSTGAQPRPDALQEFRILTSNFDAEFGRNAGSIINVVTRGGTSAYHGNARGFWRPTTLSSRGYFDPTRKRYERKEIGGNFGGPVKVPYVYNGKEKTFFFVDYETRRQLIGNTRTITGLPSAKELAGDFSGLGNDLIDPSTGAPFAGNIIPADRVSPIAKFYLKYLPPADATGSARVGANEITNNTYVTFRIDHQTSAKNQVSFSSNIYDQNVFAPFAFYGADVPGFGSEDKRRTVNYIARDTWIISSNVVNSLLLAYARNNQPSLAPENTTTPAQIGFTGKFVANDTYAGPPTIFLYERDLQLGNSYQGPQARVTENFQIQDGLSWNQGNHRFKFGFDGTQYRGDQAFLFINQGIFGFSGVDSPNTTGDDLADFMIGTTPQDTQFGSNGLRDFRQSMVSVFAQDTWKVSRALTLTLGLRWEYSSPVTDKFDRMAFYRLGTTSQLLQSGRLTQLDGTKIVVEPGGRAPNGLVYIGDPDPVLGGLVPRGGVRKDFNNWAPRFGIAYSPSGDGFLGPLLGKGKTVIRTGFGVYYGAIIGDTALQSLTATGYSKSDAYYYPASGTLADPFLPDPFPNYGSTGYDPNIGSNPNPFARTSIGISAPLSQFARPIDPNIRTPYTYQYNFTIERSLGANYVMTLSYVGNRGVKLYAQEEVNYAYGTFIPAPAGRTIPAVTTTGTNTNARRINTDIALGLQQMISAGYSNYNAFEAQLQRRFSKNLEFQAAYTFAKSISDSDTSRDTLDLVDRQFNRTLSAADVPHRLVGSWVYEFPFAKGLTTPFKRVLDGWSVGGIVTFQSGTPFTVSNISTYNTTGTGGGISSYADLGAPLTLLDPRQNNNRAFNAEAYNAFGSSASGFVLARDFRRGTSKANMNRLNNGINNWDLIVTKKTKLWAESAGLELRFEFFNAFNHTQFANADLNLSNKTRGSFGKFTSTRDPRIIQLGARFTF